MGHLRTLTAIVVPALLILAVSAGAATITEVSGMVKLNGEAVSGAETPFPDGGRLDVVGEGSQAVVLTGSGDRMLLMPGSQMVLSQVTEEKEVYDLMAGSFLGKLTPKTVVQLPNDGRIEVAEGSAELAVETRQGGTRTAIDVSEGQAILRSGGQFATRVSARQSVVVTFRRDNPRRLAFATGPDSEGTVAVFDQAAPDLQIEVDVPKASSGRMTSVDTDTKTKIENSLDSSKEGKLEIVSRVKGEETARGQVAPGVFAYVLHDSGAIEFEYVEIDFQVLKRDIGLTSEFQTLAVSNFTGVEAPVASPDVSPDVDSGDNRDQLR